MAPIRKGKIGSSLKSESAQSKMGKNANIGIMGEKKLWSMLTENANTRPYGIWSSLGIPQVRKKGKGGWYTTKDYANADVDFAIANGNKIVLVDAKKYASGKFYWGRKTIMEGLFTSKKDGKGKPIVMGRNMENALDKYRAREREIRKQFAKQGKNYPEVHISAMVVFVPTPKLPKSVRFLVWPGGIKSYLPQDAIRKITKILGKPDFSEPGTAKINPVAEALLNEQVK